MTEEIRTDNKETLKNALERIAELEQYISKLEETVWERDGEIFKAKEIIKDMLRDIPNRMWYTDSVVKQAEDFIKE